MDPAVIAVSIPIVAIVFGIGIGAQAIWAEHKSKVELIDPLCVQTNSTVDDPNRFRRG